MNAWLIIIPIGIVLWVIMAHMNKKGGSNA